MKQVLLALLLTPITLYFLLIACQPTFLAQPARGLPVSIWLALGLIWYGFLLTLLSTWLSNRRDRQP